MIKNFRRIAIGMLAIGFWLQAAGPLSTALGGVILTTSATEDGSVNGVTVNTGPMTSNGAPITSELVARDGNAAASSMATALIGNLGAEARYQEFGASGGRFSADATYSDTVIFSGPGTEPILVSLNLHFGGSLNSTDAAGAEAEASVSIGSSLTRLFVLNAGGVPGIRENTFGGLGPPATSYDTTLTSQSILVPLNTPVSISLSLTADAGAAGFNTSGTALFSDTFSLLSGAPLFNLPEGFTVNSATSFIVDNRFAPPGASVPEPSTLVMASILFGTFGVVALRKRLKT